MLILIEHLKNKSTYYFIAVVIACFMVIFVMAMIYAKWLKRNRNMRVLFLQSLGFSNGEDCLQSL
jgi:predicted permease